MAQYEDQMDKRRERREAARKKRQAEQKRLKIALISAAVVLVACVAGFLFITKNTDHLAGSQANVPTQTEATKPTRATEPTKTRTEQLAGTPTTIHIKAAGDLNVTDRTVDAGLNANGLDYTRAFMDVAPILCDADLTVVNFEGNIYGEPYGTERTSAPIEMLESLRSAGVDLIQMANSCAINNGLNGLTSTLQAIRAAGLEPIGAFSNSTEFQQSGGYTICQVEDIKICFVAFTKGLGGRGLPAGNEDCVNLLYNDYSTTYTEVNREGITKILRNAAKEKPDITIALLHWGSEYLDGISKTQESIATLMMKEGVDVILGTHPHTVQNIDFNQNAGTLIAYSLGDFFGDASRGGTNYSIILDLEITKDPTKGTTKVTDFSMTPIYTLTAEDCDGYHRVVRLEQQQVAYLGNYVDKVTKECNDDLAYSLTRIDARTAPPVEEE